MRELLASSMRTTLDLDASVLRQLRERQRSEGKTMGQVASELLAAALAVTEDNTARAPLDWTVHAMGARVDLDDRDAVQALLDEPR